MKIEKVALIHIVDKKLLGVRSKGREAFFMPGGKREGSETDAECLERELREELGIKLDKKSMDFLEDFEAPAYNDPTKTIFEICYSAGFSGELKPNTAVDEIGWLTSADIGTARLSEMGDKILKFLNKHELIN